MDYTILEKSALFSGIPAKELCNVLNTVPHHIQRYDKGETILWKTQAESVLFWKETYRRKSHSRTEVRSMFLYERQVN